MEILTLQNVQGAPALVVEVLSPSTRKRDLGVKRRPFERAGVREYWIVDPVLNRVEVHRRDRTGVMGVATHLESTPTGVLTTPILPGFELPLSRVFA